MRLKEEKNMLRNLKYKSLYIGLTTCLIISLYSPDLFAADVTLFWDPPTTNADGSPLTDLAGYVIYYGTATGDYTQSIDVGNATTYQVSNLTKGVTYYFVVTTYDTLWNESNDSDEVSTTITTSETEESDTGYFATPNLWIRAVINTVEKGPVDAIWKKGGEDTTSRGDMVIWGHFYASPFDVTWGSENNPDLFVKIWFDVSGRIDVNFFHVSVPDIEVYSEYSYDGIADEQGTTTMDRRYIRHSYEHGNSYYYETYEDGIPVAGYWSAGNPYGYSTINNLGYGSLINTVEKGSIEAVWRLGGQDTTERGDQVVWGHFYASPFDVSWGSQENPDLYVKIWFDVSGRVDVNFFHVSVPDIEVYSDYPDNGIYDQKGTTIMPDRYIRHEYWR